MGWFGSELVEGLHGTSSLCLLMTLKLIKWSEHNMRWSKHNNYDLTLLLLLLLLLVVVVVVVATGQVSADVRSLGTQGVPTVFPFRRLWMERLIV